MKHRPDIDGIRCLAVMPVVLCHAGFPLFAGGFIGVDVFFVVSGYLITGILLADINRGSFSLARFYERRARRILPAALSVILACLVAGWFILLPDEYASLGVSSIAAIGFVSNIRFFGAGSDYFGAGVAFDPLLHTWSLAVEEQFYLFFPALLVMLLGPLSRYRLAILSGLCIASFALSVYGLSRDQIATFYLLPTRFWELGFGALLAIGVIPAARNRVTAEASALFGLFLVVGSVLLIDETMPFPGWLALPACLGTCLLIWSGSDRPTTIAKALAWRPFVAIGLISYSLYLWHWPLIVFTRIWFATADLSLEVALACVLSSLILAALSWRFIEQPFRVRGGRPTVGPKRVLAWSASGIAAASVVALLPFSFAGFPHRVPPETQMSYRLAKDRGTLSIECEERSAAGSGCRIGEQWDEEGEPDVVVWGDSHSLAMLNAFDEVLDEHDLTGVAYVRPACASLIGVVRSDKHDGRECATHNERVLGAIRLVPEDTTVLLISRWALLAEGDRAAGEAGTEAHLAPVETAGSDFGLSRETLMFRGLDSTVRELKEEGLRVIVMRPTPEFGYDVPKALVRQAWTGNEITSLDRNDYVRRARDTNAIIDAVVSRHQAQAIAPGDILCPKECVVQLGETILYQDDDHLSQAGSEWLLRRLVGDGLLNLPQNDG
ncbi:acyltransferase family protein [Qipengyuania sp. XHP0207]|uniref:acyltransferase family protein n=1 Tax=Qipengyuania sp. XHP0207 TaxID=3038078 RepID=UPI00241BFDA2|nr:acyltransferase family protein [Qipengyuania sp. XHP0207]MDG5748626.1 acyltransferase family protein [Qipengyuania sp. XHP0207]